LKKRSQSGHWRPKKPSSSAGIEIDAWKPCLVSRKFEMPCGSPHLVPSTVVVEGELELFVLFRNAEEVVRRLEFAVADDREFAAELEPEGSVEGAALFSGSVIRYMVCR
jgi:hypothetical protein